MDWIEELRQERASAQEVVRKRRLEDFLMLYGLSLLVIGPALGLGLRWLFTGSPT